MTFSVSPHRAPAFTPLAHALALSFCLTAAAHADEPVASVLITGPRFASDPALAPIGATVITADEIRRAGVDDVNQAIRKVGGVYGRQSLDSSPDFGLDLRGFGANSSENLVVVLDGVRMSENELANAVLSSIPIETVERIEITRGGSSVLYGDGATGGVIRIVTRRPGQARQRGTLSAELGQFGQRDLRASAARSWDGFALDAAIGSQRSDNYRANNDFRQTTFSGGAQWTFAGGRAGVRVDSARQQARFPGSLTLAQFEADPRQANTPNDKGSLDTDRITAFAEQRIGGVELAAELSHREKSAAAAYFGDGFVSKVAYEARQTQFSPRLRQLTRPGDIVNELVAGIDLIRWSRLTASDFSSADATQTSKALYVRDEVRWDAAHNGRFSLGARRELFDKHSLDTAPYTSATYDAVQGQDAWEVQGSYGVLPALNLYARAGQSYRVANADENAYTPKPNVTLRGQTSHDLELGATIGSAARQLTARVFRHRLENEIFYDPTVFANTNLDPTRREGFELDANAQLAAGWRATAHFQHVKAAFSGGPDAGREMVLVPANVLSARLSWMPTDGQSADVGAQWVDSQRYGSDFANDCGARIPAYTTFDARYARKIGAWELALAGLNLGDRQYFSNAFGCRSGIYPSDGRQLKVSARYDF